MQTKRKWTFMKSDQGHPTPPVSPDPEPNQDAGPETGETFLFLFSYILLRNVSGHLALNTL